MVNTKKAADYLKETGFEESGDFPFDDDGDTKTGEEEEKTRLWSFLGQAGYMSLWSCAFILVWFIFVPVMIIRYRRDLQDENERAAVRPIEEQVPPQLPSSQPSMPPSVMTIAPTRPLPVVLANLPPFTLESLEDTGSAQFETYLWMANDPNVHTYSVSRVLQRFALGALYFSTGGPSSWIQSDSFLSNDIAECQWAGVTCSTIIGSNNTNTTTTTTATITALDMKENGLVGSLPSEISFLSDLGVLDLEGNELFGTIPSEIGMMTQLTELDLSENLLQGSLPTQIGHLTNMVSFQLQQNLLTGTLPTEIGQLGVVSAIVNGTNSSQISNATSVLTNATSVLTTLDVSRNSLTGDLPTEIGYLSSLLNLRIARNGFDTVLPTSLGQMTSLRWLYLAQNNFGGTIPTELAHLQDLRAIQLEGNALRGTIPSELANLTQLARFWLSSNHLQGSVPTELCERANETGMVIWIDCAEVTCTCNCWCS